jgi:hypothetical protein
MDKLSYVFLFLFSFLASSLSLLFLLKTLYDSNNKIKASKEDSFDEYDSSFYVKEMLNTKVLRGTKTTTNRLGSVP